MMAMRPWFWGKIGGDVTEMLKGQQEGTFCVRYSSQPKVPFSISILTIKGVEHVRVYRFFFFFFFFNYSGH